MPKGKENEYFGGGMVTNDARNRNVNTMGDGLAPKPQPRKLIGDVAGENKPWQKPMMPSEPSNEVEGSYVDPYNEDIAPVITGGGMYKKGGKVEKYKSGGEIKKYKDGKLHKEDGYKKAARKASVYIADPKEKEPHGGAVEGKRRSKRTIGKRKKP